ncbi:MAG: SecDF P1 head subdomain-containing protein, partial [Armatimonadaceae bacterium]
MSEIVIRALGADKIELIIPEVDEAAADEIWQRLVRTGHLQFRIVATSGGIHNKEIAAAEALAAKGETSRNIMMTNAEGQQYVAARWYSLARENVTEEVTPDTIIPIKDVPVPSALVRDRQTGQLINMSEVPFVSKDSGRDFAVWLKEKGIRSPQVLMLEPREDMNVEGKDLYNIMQSIDQYGRPSVAFSIRGPAVSKMRKLTTRYRPTEDGNKYHRGIGIDDQVHSAPTINSEISGSGVIEGRFTEKEIEDLIITLQSGKIDVALNPVPISKQFVQSTLGEELKQKGIYALIVSYLAIFVFVMVYYQWFAGTIANIALFLNLVLTLAVVMAINQPLTL